MEKLSKDKLILEVNRSKEESKYLQNKLRDLVTAYKSLLKEKEALEEGFKAFKNVSEGDKAPSETDEPTEAKSKETNAQDDQKYSSELTMLMNSLSTLSAEKSRMEATFQADKKMIRQEKDKYEAMVRELQDKLKIVTFDLTKELEHLKSNIIIERHEREKEQIEHNNKIRDLQSQLSHEKNENLYLQQTLSDVTSRKEVERYIEIDLTEKFVNLEKKHMLVLEHERKKVLQIENDFKENERVYEQRIAVLENRIAELSNSLVKYNLNKQQDQNEILKLRVHVNELSVNPVGRSEVMVDSGTQTSPLDTLKDKNEAYLSNHVRAIQDKLIYYENLLLTADKYPKNTLSDDFKASTSQNLTDKMDMLRLQENKNELDNLKIKVAMLTEQNNLLNDQLDETINRYERQLQDLKEQQAISHEKHENEKHGLHVNYKAQIMDLEIQVQKQRERTLALLDEKEQEVATLKSSFQLFVPGKHSSLDNPTQITSQLNGVLDGSAHNAQENPHILHYAHELARRDVVITGLRKNCNRLENSLRDMTKELIMMRQASLDQVSNLRSQITRLETCQSREGANLEYLKNVIVNYLHSKNSSSKRHMLNAIAAVLKLTDTEMCKIKSAL